MSTKFLVNPSGRVVDVTGSESAMLLRQGFREATQSEIERAFPEHAGVGGPRLGATGYDSLTNIRPAESFSALSHAPANPETDKVLAGAGDALRARLGGGKLPTESVITNTTGVIAALTEDKRLQQVQDTLNKAAEQAPESVQDGRVAAAEGQIKAAKLEGAVEEARLNAQIEAVVERAHQAEGNSIQPGQVNEALRDAGNDLKRASGEMLGGERPTAQELPTPQQEARADQAAAQVQMQQGQQADAETEEAEQALEQSGDEQPGEQEQPAKLTGKSAIPDDFPGGADLKAAGLNTLGDVADHDFDEKPVKGVKDATRKRITDYLGQPNVELDG